MKPLGAFGAYGALSDRSEHKQPTPLAPVAQAHDARGESGMDAATPLLPRVSRFQAFKSAFASARQSLGDKIRHMRAARVEPAVPPQVPDGAEPLPELAALEVALTTGSGSAVDAALEGLLLRARQDDAALLDGAPVRFFAGKPDMAVDAIYRILTSGANRNQQDRLLQRLGLTEDLPEARRWSPSRNASLVRALARHRMVRDRLAVEMRHPDRPAVARQCREAGLRAEMLMWSTGYSGGDALRLSMLCSATQAATALQTGEGFVQSGVRPRYSDDPLPAATPGREVYYVVMVEHLHLSPAG